MEKVPEMQTRGVSLPLGMNTQVEVNLDELSLRAREVQGALERSRAKMAAIGRESEVWAWLKVEWSKYRFPRALDDPRYRFQRIEARRPRGIPDLMIQDRYWGETAWLELKSPIVPKKWPRTYLQLGIKPQQALWCWQHYLDGGRAGVLARMRSRLPLDREWWLWVPATHHREWPVLACAPNGWLLLPHVVGTGPVPDPARLWSLDAESRPSLDFSKPSSALYQEVSPWARDPVSRIAHQPRQKSFSSGSRRSKSAASP